MPNTGNVRSILVDCFLWSTSALFAALASRVTPPRIAAERIRTITIAGARGNRARFFDQYYKDHVPIENLTFLAGHIVLSAAIFDSAMIRGLDIALFDDNGCRLLAGERKQMIRERSKGLADLIQQELTQN